MTEIRLATPDDDDHIWRLIEPVFRAGETYAVDPMITRDAALAMWVDAPRATYVALLGGQIVGTYYIKSNQQGSGDHICNCGYIVAETARGQGIAAAMCAASQDQAREFGYSAMQFNFVLASNSGAVGLWQKLGFSIVGTIPQAFRHPRIGLVDAHVMHKSL